MAPPQKNLEISTLPNYNFLHHATQSLSKILSLNYLMQVTMLYQRSYSYLAIFKWWTYGSQNKVIFPMNFNFDQVLTDSRCQMTNLNIVLSTAMKQY